MASDFRMIAQWFSSFCYTATSSSCFLTTGGNTKVHLGTVTDEFMLVDLHELLV